MWDVALKFEGDDETTKLNTQNCSIGSRIFEAYTAASFFATEEVHSTPHLCCTSSQSHVVVSVDGCISILNEDCQNVVFKLILESYVDCMCLSPDSELLLVAENIGIVHAFHIATQTKIWSLPLVEKNDDKDKAFVDALFSTDDRGWIKIFLLTHQQLFVFYNIDSSALYQGILNGNLKEVINGVEQCCIALNEVFPEYNPVCLFEDPTDSVYPIVLSGYGKGTKLTKSLDEGISGIKAISSADPSVGIRKAFCTSDGRYFISLDSLNKIRVLCGETFMLLKLWDEANVIDFVLNEKVIDPSSYETERTIGIVVEILDEDASKCCQYQIRLFPSFKLIYVAPLKEYAVLGNCHANQDAMYILERESVNHGLASSFSLKCISESSYDTKLTNLLNKKKFVKAETFAQTHHLDLQIIYKTKIKHLLKDLSSSQQALSTIIGNIISELESCLFKVKDMMFIDSCLNIHLSSFEEAKKFYLLCQKWIKKHPCSGDEKDKLMIRLNKVLNSMVTFEILRESKCIGIQWQEFFNTNLLTYFIQHLQYGNINIVFILWQRHQNEFLHEFTEEILDNILGSIPESMASHYLIPFLQENFIPPVLRAIPESLGCVINWLMERTKLLAVNEKEHWPSVGKKFLGIINDVINNLNNSSSSFMPLYSIHRENLIVSSHFGRMSLLMRSLDDLIELENVYNCQMSLSEYCQDKKLTVIFRMLDRLQDETMTLAITKFIKRFASENGYTLDSCLCNYVKDVLDDSPYTWWNLEEAPWQKRLLIVISCIEDTNLWMEAAVAIVFRATIPWSTAIHSLVDKGLTLDHPKKELLKAQFRLVGLKRVLLKYQMHGFPINNDTEMALPLIMFILKQDKNSSLNDAIAVSQAYETLEDWEVHMMYLKFFLSEDRLEDMKKHLASLPRDDSLVFCKRLLRFIRMCLDDEFMAQSHKTYLHTLAQASVLIQQHLNEAKCPVDVKMDWTLAAMVKLQKEFSLYIPMCSLSSKRKCWELVESYIKLFMTGKIPETQVMEKNNIALNTSINQIYRLAALLNLNREDVTARLINAFLENKKHESAMQLCNELTQLNPTEKTAAILMDVVKYFLGELSKSENLGSNTIVNMIHQLASMSIAYCNESSLSQYSSILQHSFIMAKMSQLTIHEMPMTIHSNDLYQKWGFSRSYCDEGLCIEPSKMKLFFSEALIQKVLKDGSISTNFDYLPLANEVVSKCATCLTQKGHGLSSLHFIEHSMSLLVPAISTTSQVDSTVLTVSEVQPIIESLSYQLLKNIIQQRDPDLMMALSILNLVSREKIIKISERLLKCCSSDIKRVLKLHLLAVEYFNILGEFQIAAKFRKNFDKLYWFSKHSTGTYSAEDILKMGYQEEQNLVKEIIKSHNLDLEAVVECGKLFSVELDDICTFYLNNIFIGPKVKKWDFLAQLPQKEIEQTVHEVECVIKKISNVGEILMNLRDILEVANPYYYELLLPIHQHILKLMEHINPDDMEIYEKGVSLLKFLLVYERESPPLEMEIQQWHLVNPEHSLPLIANKRLPFHSVMKNMHKIINPELKISTADVWLTAAPLLKLQPDDLKMIAIKNSVTCYIEQQLILGISGIRFTADPSFLEPLHNLLQKIQSPENLAGCLMWVINKFPLSSNKLLIAEQAVNLVNQQLSLSPNDKKLSYATKNLFYTSQHIAIELSLHKNDVASDVCLSLLKNPRQLINHLIENICTPVRHCIKVCKAMQEIAYIVTDIQLRDVYFSYLCKWLAPTKEETPDLDETTFFLGSPISKLPYEITQRENMERAICLLLGLPKPIQYELLKLLLNRFSDHSITYKAHFFCCLTSVLDETSAAEIWGCEVHEVKQSLEELLCLAELEDIHLPFSMEMIHNCTKIELVERILISHAHDRNALLVCVKLCLKYKIWVSNIWLIILQKLRDKDMVDELDEILKLASGDLSSIWQNDIFESCWSLIIMNIFQKDSHETAKIKIIRELYKVLLRCPCLSLDMTYVWKKISVLEIVPSDFTVDQPINISIIVSMLHQNLYGEGKLSPINLTSIEDTLDQLTL